MASYNAAIKIKPRQNSIQEIIKTFDEFCNSTSLDGYAYLRHSSSSLIWKAIWILVILAANGLAISFVATNTSHYLKSDVITNIESSTEPLNVSLKRKSVTCPTLSQKGRTDYIMCFTWYNLSDHF